MTIIDRLKAATGPDRELDGAIYAASEDCEFIKMLGDDYECAEVRRAGFGFTRAEIVPTYTASIDAALALVERMLPESGYMLTRGRCSPDEPLFGFQIYRSDFIQDDAGPEPIGLPSEHNSLPLAILTALFAALQGSTTHADK